MSEKKVNYCKEIDFIKFVAMLIIVQGHAGVSVISCLQYIPPVHVGLFFVCSGYFLPDDYILSDYICKRIKRLYIPFVGFSLIFILLHNYLTTEVEWMYSNINHYYLVLSHSFLMDVTEPLLAPMWFITALFYSSLLFVIIQKSVQKLDRKNIIKPIGLETFLFLALLFYGLSLTNKGKVLTWSYQNPEIINVSLVAVFFIYIGFLLKKYYYIFMKNKGFLYFISGIVCFTINYVLLKMSPQGVGVRVNVWGNIFVYIIEILCTWHFLFVIGYYLAKIKILYFIISAVANDTMWIMALHMLCLRGWHYYFEGNKLPGIMLIFAVGFPIVLHFIFIKSVYFLNTRWIGVHRNKE